jgi:hypothetical protein
LYKLRSSTGVTGGWELDLSGPGSQVTAVFSPSPAGTEDVFGALHLLHQAVTGAGPQHPPHPSAAVQVQISDGTAVHAYGTTTGPDGFSDEWLHIYPPAGHRTIFDHRTTDPGGGPARIRPHLSGTATSDDDGSAMHRWLRDRVRFIGGRFTPLGAGPGLPGRIAAATRRHRAYTALFTGADLGISGVTVTTGDHVVFLHEPHDVALPLHDESSGTLVWADLLAHVLDTIDTGTTLIVDDLGAGLHPRLAAAVVELFNDPDCNPRQAQLLFTTKVTTLFGDGLGEPVLSDGQAWVTGRDTNGPSLTRLNESGAQTARQRERRLRQGRHEAGPGPRV